MDSNEATVKATICYNEGCLLARNYLMITDAPEALSAVVASMLFAKFCKSEFIASLGKEHENDAGLFLQEMEEMVDLKVSDFIQHLRRQKQ